MHFNRWRIQLFLFLFFLNSVYLYIYFSAHPDFLRHHSKEESDRSYTGNRHTLRENHRRFQFPVASTAKTWPILPSYLPWSLNPNVSVGSCEGYFGNGFTRRIDVLEAAPVDVRRKSVNVGGRGWFRCFYSETLRSSICEGGWIRMHPEKIQMSIGGENLDLVIGRGEEEELPDFEPGAFDIEVPERSIGDGKLVNSKFLDDYLPRGVISKHTVRALVDSIRLIGTRDFDCAEWVEEPTLLVTRFEYANLFHTVTDWYSAYVSSRVTDLPSRPHLVFVDGHCVTPLEETWKALFSSIRYAKKFKNPVCFRHAILSPLGYETAFFKGLTEDPDCHGASAQELWQKPNTTKTARISEFGEMIRASFGFPVDRHRSMKPTSTHNILFVRREDYLAHPRHGGKVESRLSNEQEVFDAMQTWLTNRQRCKLNLVNGLFAHMPMKDQVRAIRDASVIVGAHGAGLTHIVSATPKTIIFEIISSEFRRPHFSLISEWKGLEYHAKNLDGSYANLSEVIDILEKILHSLGC